MKKRGFTLIELLAVIIILAIIALIAIPLMTGVIGRSKKGASKASIQNYLHEIETQVVAYRIDGEMISNGTYRINEDGDVCINSDCTKKLGISMKGKEPSSGVVTIEEGKVVSAFDLYVNPKYYRYIDGEILEFEPGGYDSNNQLVADWDTLVKEGYIILSSNKKTITGHDADKMSNISTLVISSTITSIGNRAFEGCTSLNSITMSSNVTSIGSQAFDGCINLKFIVIPDSVTSISGYAFRDCKSLTSINIPHGVTVIEVSAFQRCSSLTSIIIPNSVTSILQDAFNSCTGLTSIIIPEGVTSIGHRVFSGCTGLTSIIIPEGVTSIGGSAFYNCKNLQSITLPSTLIGIGDGAFSSCTSLTSITIPEGVRNIGGKLFFDSKNLNSITVDPKNQVYEDANSNVIIKKSDKTLVAGCKSSIIPAGTISIGVGAFGGSGLTSVSIPSSVTTIKYQAFDFCYSLSGIVIPSSVNTIEGYAFRDSRGPITFNNPNDWSAGDSAISASDLSNGNTAATYLRSTYVSRTWTRN